MASRKAGRTWKLFGVIRKAGKTVRDVERFIEASSEAEVERAERHLRSALYELALKLFKERMKGITIDVESDVEARKTVGPSGPERRRK